MSGKYSTPDQVMIKLTDPAERNLGSVKSLNVPAVSKVVENKLIFRGLSDKVKCIECKKSMTLHEHFK